MSASEPQRPSKTGEAVLGPPPDGPGNGRGRFPVVGVGASAGGLEALTELLGHLPPDPGMALLVVQHLDPKRESLLASILATSSALPVVQAGDGMHLEKDHVYVIPPNSDMAVSGGRLRLSPRPGSHEPHMPVDVLFRSLAVEHGPRAIGVVLSGGGTDGALGVTEIKGVGGITFAQDDESARHDSMPRSAVGTSCIDYTLAPAAIAAELLRISRHPYLAAPPAAPEESFPDDQLALLRRVLGVVRIATGVDFSKYRRNTVLRRVQRRMALRRQEGLAAYLRLLQDDPEEVLALQQDLLIRVTQFFRDPASFEALQQEVFPGLIRGRAADEPIRIWAAGCSTGEEVYSLAIVLLESLGEAAGLTPIKILATDVSERYLDAARSGRYIENIAMDVSPERLRRFFSRTDADYKVNPSLRDLCVFSRHDLTRDPPFARLDLISCRNLLIYFDLEVQKRVLSLFHYALKEGAHLLLGPSETIGAMGDLFEAADAEQKIYTRRAVAPRAYPAFDLDTGSPGSGRAPAGRSGAPVLEAIGTDLQREADRLALAQFAPPGVLIDEDLRVLQFRGRTDAYLVSPPGSSGLGLLRIAREGLRHDLKLGLKQVKSGEGLVRHRGVRFEEGGVGRTVDLVFIPVRPSAGGRRFFLVLFDEHDDAPAPPADGPADDDDPEAARREIHDLRRELQATREYLQSVVEEHEATTEELRSANEEILSSNEELQSTNEELQTAKEEMQSANEELSTVNDELNHRNREVGRVNDDLLNLFGGINIPIVMVSRDLRIRRFTPPAERLLNLIPSDVGRPIGNIRPNLDSPDLDRRISEVIASLAPQDFEALDREGRWHSVRIRPYITLDNRIDGAVVVIVDIDEIRQGTERLRRACDYADAIIETVWQPLAVLDADLNLMRANGAFYRLCRDQAAGRTFAELFDDSPGGADLVASLRAVLAEGRALHGREVEVAIRSVGRRTLRLNARPIDWQGSGTPMVLLLAMEDVTDLKREQDRDRLLAREQAARHEAERANHRKDEFLAMLAHELRNPLAPILNALLMLRSPDGRPEDAAWAAEIMERQVRHMGRLIDDLLDVSRVVRGKIQLRRERVDLADLVGRAADAVRPFVESRRHQLTVSLAPGPMPLDADPMRIEQVLSNLVQNAAKYTPEGGKIWLEAGREGDRLVVRVRDTGLGIATDALPRVFDLFMQADRSLDRALGGLGIGLTLVKTLVELHGGRVEAQSEGPGRGSEFIVRLPAAPAGPGAAPGPAPPEAVPAAAMRVLVVDDNRDAARTLARLLARWGHEVRVAHDGDEAMREARSFHPEIVFLDIGLPHKDGYEVARLFRADRDTAGAVLVALTGYGQSEDRRHAFDVGFDEHAVKPIDEGQLRAALATRRTPKPD